MTPIFFVLPCIGYVTRVASILSAVAELNLPVLMHTLEESIEMNEMVEYLRSKLLDKSKGAGLSIDDQKKKVAEIFQTIDVDGSGEIDEKEFRMLLKSIQLTFSSHRFRILYRAIDFNRDGAIELSELISFLFPDDTNQENSLSLSEKDLGK